MNLNMLNIALIASGILMCKEKQNNKYNLPNLRNILEVY